MQYSYIVVCSAGEGKRCEFKNAVTILALIMGENGQMPHVSVVSASGGFDPAH